MPGKEYYMATIYYHAKPIDVQEGISLGDLAIMLRADEDGDVMLARVNGSLTELFKSVRDGQTVEFLNAATLAGFETYRRSCSMLFMKAAKDVIGADRLHRTVLHFSMGAGFYYTLEGSFTLTDELVSAIGARMRELVNANIRFMKKSVRTKEAREMFRNSGMEDKDRLFRFRLVSRTNIYALEDFQDYNYGYMVWKTGVLKLFSLHRYGDGVILQLPKRRDPMTLPPFETYDKHLQAQIEAERWASQIHIQNIGELNERISEGGMSYPVLLCEAYHESRIAEIARQIAERADVKFVMIAGPSSSGKTTFSQRLSVQLATYGLHPHYVGVDNYFVNREDTPLDEDGNKNYECLEAIDVKQFNEDMNDLLAGREIRVPSFNFIEGKREYKGDTLKLNEGDILVIEGIHCLNDRLSYALPAESKFRIYISALVQLNIDEHNRIPTSDGRLLRRMVRDNRTRGYSAKHTLSMWDSVRRGEEQYIYPYQESADAFFNSALPYELAILKSYAQPILYQIAEDDPEYDEAKRLLKFLDYVIGMPSESVPVNSILREFIGGGCFHL